MCDYEFLISEWVELTRVVELNAVAPAKSGFFGAYFLAVGKGLWSKAGWDELFVLAQATQGATLLLSFPGQEPHPVAFERVGFLPALSLSWGGPDL